MQARMKQVLAACAALPLALAGTSCSMSSMSQAPDVVVQTSTQWVEPTDEVQAEGLRRSDIATACEEALRSFLDSAGYDYTYISADPFSIPMDVVLNSEFSGDLKGSIDSPAYSGEFSFQCATDTVRTDIGNVGLPDPSAAPPTTAAPTSTLAAPIDPKRIDPDNDRSGRSGRDDNAGIFYHNSVDWEFLKRPGQVVPGARIWNTTSTGFCSTGFLASLGNRLFIITAGHCGNVGDTFLIENNQGETLVIGEMVESYVEWEGEGIVGSDIGLIELYDSARPYVSSSLPTTYKLQGWITPQEAQRRDMMICRLGSTTGYACGSFEEIGQGGLFYFRNIVDRGDSGGAIFALDDSGAWALGVTSNVSDYNKTYAGGMEIAGALQKWGLTLHG